MVRTSDQFAFVSDGVDFSAMPASHNGNGFAPQPETGARIRRLRLERDLDQIDLATDNVSHAQVSRIEAGKRAPSMNALIDLAERLKVTALYLATGSFTAPCPVCDRTAKRKRT
jgi:DNA-binding XRE family transcriptional regulator